MQKTSPGIIVTTISLLLAVLPLFATLSNAVATESGGQYILFSGTIEADITYSPEVGAYCERYFRSISPLNRTYLAVGKYPSWDKNPFFFEVLHHASDRDPDFLPTYTQDDIFNLYFQSAYYDCYKDGKSCPSGYVFNYYYVPIEYLDLNKTSVQKTTVGNEDGYIVTGSSESYVGNQTGLGVDVDADCLDPLGKAPDQKGVSWMDLIWDKSIQFDYKLKFSNSTAEWTITTTKPNNASILTLTFKGQRNATHEDENNSPVELDSASSSTPHFRYLNGSSIYFTKTYDSWIAAATPFPTPSVPIPTPTNAAAKIGGNVAGVYAGALGVGGALVLLI